MNPKYSNIFWHQGVKVGNRGQSLNWYEVARPLSINLKGGYHISLVKLNPDAFKRLIEAFEKKLTTTFYYPLAERNLTYSDVIIFQAGHYRKVLEGEVDVYQPILLK